MRPPRCDGGCGRRALYAYLPVVGTVLFLCLVHVPDEETQERHPGRWLPTVQTP